MLEMLQLDFMRNAFIAAVLVGAAAPAVGVFLVQRRLSLIGDGLGHVALAGVAVGVLTGHSPLLTALLAAVLCAGLVEFIRVKGTTSADIVLSLMFYGGIAAGVVLLSRAGGQGTSIQQYLFGSLLTAADEQLWQFAVLAVISVGATTVLRKRLFAVANDEEYARSVGMPVLRTNLALSVLTAATIVLSMRVIGLLLISALMILPNATGQRLGGSFRIATWWAVIVGAFCGAGGVTASYYLDTPSGGTVVLLAVAVFIVAACVAAILTSRRKRRAQRSGHPHRHADGCGHDALLHDDHVDYIHDRERHAVHGDRRAEHWDDHSSPDDLPKLTKERT